MGISKFLIVLAESKLILNEVVIDWKVINKKQNLGGLKIREENILSMKIRANALEHENYKINIVSSNFHAQETKH